MEVLNYYLRRILFLPPQASSFSKPIDHIHYLIIGTTMIIGFFLFLTIAIFCLKYRRRGSEKFPVVPKVTAKVPMEIVLWGVPLTTFLVWFFLGFHWYVRVETPPPDAMDIYVMAKKWMWKFTYPGGPSSLNVLRVPVGRDVRLLMTSRDVIHSLFVPAFRDKQDVLPDRYTQMWFKVMSPGSYVVYCAEYCGLKHSYMWAKIIALPPHQFDEWLSKQEQGEVAKRDARPSKLEGNLLPFPAHSDLVSQGLRVAEAKGCFQCHSSDGKAGTGPTWLDLYGKRVTLSDGKQVRADEAYLTQSMMEPDSQIVRGFQPLMPSFRDDLTAAQAGALVEYIKSLRSPRAGQLPGEPPSSAVTKGTP